MSCPESKLTIFEIEKTEGKRNKVSISINRIRTWVQLSLNAKN